MKRRRRGSGTRDTYSFKFLRDLQEARDAIPILYLQSRSTVHLFTNWSASNFESLWPIIGPRLRFQTHTLIPQAWGSLDVETRDDHPPPPYFAQRWDPALEEPEFVNGRCETLPDELGETGMDRRDFFFERNENRLGWVGGEEGVDRVENREEMGALGTDAVVHCEMMSEERAAVLTGQGEARGVTGAEERGQRRSEADVRYTH